VIAADADHLEAYSLLGVIYARQNRIEEARRQFSDLVERDPASVSARTVLALLLQQEGKIAEAEQEYERILATDAHAAVAANNLAWIYVSSNQKMDEALELARVAHERLLEYPSVNDTLGWIYFRKHMGERAVECLQLAARKAPDVALYQFHLGMALAQNGDWGQARSALWRALLLQPDFERASEARKALAALGE
jgi:Flp pilus assembly protein TadD